MREMRLSDSVSVETMESEGFRLFTIDDGDSAVTLLSDEADGLVEFIKENINHGDSQ